MKRRFFSLIFLFVFLFFSGNIFSMNLQTESSTAGFSLTSKSVYALSDLAKSEEVKNYVEVFLKDWEKLKILESEGASEEEINKKKQELLEEIHELKKLAEKNGESEEFLNVLSIAETKLNVSVARNIILKPILLVKKVPTLTPMLIKETTPVIIGGKNISKDFITYVLWKKWAVSPQEAVEVLKEVYALSSVARNEGISETNSYVAREIKIAEEHFYVDYVIGRLYQPEEYEVYKLNKQKFLRDLLNKIIGEKNIKLNDIDYVKLLGKNKETDWSKVVVAEVDSKPLYLSEVMDLYPSYGVEIFLGSTNKPEMILRAIQMKYLKETYKQLSQNDLIFVNNAIDYIRNATIAKIFYASILAGKLPKYKVQVSDSEVKDYYSRNLNLFKIQNRLLSLDEVKGGIEKELSFQKSYSVFRNTYDTQLKSLEIKIDNEVLKTITDENIRNFWKVRG